MPAFPTSGSMAPPDLRTITLPKFGKDLVFDFMEGTSPTVVSSKARLTPEGKLDLDSGRLPYNPVGGFLSPLESFPAEDADRFSLIEREGRQEVVVEALREMEPRLVRLAVLTQGGQARVHAQLSGHQRLIPVGMMGGGFARLLSMLTLVATSPGGVVLIDEVENGLHHQTLTSVWRALFAMATKNKCQIFVTTHSRECLMAAFEVSVERGREELSMHRLQWVSDKLECVRLEARHLKLAAEMGLEVRS